MAARSGWTCAYNGATCIKCDRIRFAIVTRIQWQLIQQIARINQNKIQNIYFFILSFFYRLFVAFVLPHDAAHANRVYRYPYSHVNFHLSLHSIFAPIVAESFPLHGGLNVNSGKHTHTHTGIYICVREGEGYLRCKLFDSEGMQHCGQAGKWVTRCQFLLAWIVKCQHCAAFFLHCEATCKGKASKRNA